jgi:hypothetical protein
MDYVVASAHDHRPDLPERGQVALRVYAVHQGRDEHCRDAALAGQVCEVDFALGHRAHRQRCLEVGVVTEVLGYVEHDVGVSAHRQAGDD